METKEGYKSVKLGSKIHPELAGYLKKYTKGTDRAQVSIDTGISISTINAVIGSAHKLSKFNIPAVKELVESARNNCKRSIEMSREELESIELFIPLNVREDDKERA